MASFPTNVTVNFRPIATLVIGAIVTSIALAGCTTADQGAFQRNQSELVQDAVKLRDSNGLFRMPESQSVAPGDLYTTAVYATADPDGKLAQGLNPGTIQPAKSEQYPDLPSLWSAASLKLFSPLPDSVNEESITSLRLPQKQSSPGAEVAALWFWADTFRKLGGAPDEVKVFEVGQRMAAIDFQAMQDRPFLLWRLSDMYSALRLEQPGHLKELLNASAIDGLPATPDALYDVQAVLEVAQAQNKVPSVPDGMSDHLNKLLADGAVAEDIGRASVLRSLVLLGRSDDARKYLGRDALSGRIEPTTGLIRPIVTHPGTVEGSYWLSRLLDLDFPQVVDQKTAQSLISALGDEKLDALSRLKALVALKRTGEPSWEDHKEVIDEVRRSVPTAVTRDQLKIYLLTTDALAQVDSQKQLSRLEKFDAPLDNPELGILAFHALSMSSYFSNGAEIGGWFPEWQKALPQLLDKPSEPVSLYYAALAAMTTSPLAGLSSPDYAKASERLQELKGCGSYKALYRTKMDSTSPCSSIASVAVLGTSSMYYTNLEHTEK